MFNWALSAEEHCVEGGEEPGNGPQAGQAMEAVGEMVGAMAAPATGEPAGRPATVGALAAPCSPAWGFRVLTAASLLLRAAAER